MSYAESIAADARFYILKELHEQVDGRLNVILIQRMLEKRYAINRSREWVETQLNKLVELEAVEIVPADLVIASIGRAGRDHVERRSVIAGITRPTEID